MTVRVHLSLPTTNLEAAVAFYSALLGAGPDKERPGVARFAPAHVPVALSLQADTGAVSLAQAAHFGLRLPSPRALAQAAARLRGAGLVQAEATAETCCHATQDKVWAVDPDGRPWEAYVITDDAPGERGAPTSCCDAAAAPPACCA